MCVCVWEGGGGRKGGYPGYDDTYGWCVCGYPGHHDTHYGWYSQGTYRQVVACPVFVWVGALGVMASALRAPTGSVCVYPGYENIILCVGLPWASWHIWPVLSGHLRVQAGGWMSCMCDHSMYDSSQDWCSRWVGGCPVCHMRTSLTTRISPAFLVWT